MNWPMVKLKDCCEVVGGATPKRNIASYWEGDIPWITPKDISNLNSPFIYEAPEHISSAGYKAAATYMLPVGTILLTSRAPIGNVAIAGIELCTNQGFKSLIPGKNVYNKYLYHCIKKFVPQLELLGNGATFKEVSKKVVENFEIPLPPFEEQKRIADILDKADDIRQKREQAIKLADVFLLATFLEMFGDPVENPKGWNVFSLLEYGSFKNGMNFTKGESGTALKCLGVGDFKSLATITCVDNIAEIELNTPPSAEYLLKDGDIVFVRSNGNKALIGRCLTIYPGKEKVTFSGFCIRYRIESTSVTPEYLNFLFRTPSVKQKMLSGGQGANIQNISQGTLSSLRIPIPPLEKQQAFSKVVSFHFELMEKMDINLVKIIDMFDSISQNYFN
ncbi:restriction endonuclease subunit S [Escherichia coli]|uniref:restriction endonuclease subunit S n=1 Tax=Escherichia coli TaxID=562 RepID=UPI0003911CAB|nr:restriction endonuclease subunit S [Escherichia coli]EEV5817817.1 restriction endonuclease subunit S [Escherichia coli]EFE1435269.1 restriction endonuclease subunit S [Escherichia coli]EFH9601271.1 restriction endonuclease subunit S [Escherichia coli]EFJ2706004.1 restriction endonuclease subunit S [Escherichia coli]EFL7139421.1 restriction endonuclease subunit S [Escherichia coli]